MGERKTAQLLFPKRVGEKYIFYLNDARVFEDQTVYGIYLSNSEYSSYLSAFLNSTIARLLYELSGYGLTGAVTVAELSVILTERLLIVDPFKLSKYEDLEAQLNDLSGRGISSIFEELGADSPEQVSLEKIKPDRRELDKIVMGEILGLTEEEQLEVYRAVVDLVKSRLEKAGSVPRQAKRKGVDIEALAASILREIDMSELKKFPDEYIGGGECREIEVPKGTPEVGSDLHGFFVKIGDMRIECSSQEEARYIEYAVMNGNTKIRIPKDERVIKKVVGSYWFGL